MNTLLVAGLLILSQSLYVYSEDDLPVSSTNSKAEMAFLRELFPDTFKSKCESEQSSVKNDPENSINSIPEFSDDVNSLVDLDTLEKASSICSVLDSPLKDACIQIVSLQNQQEVHEKIMKKGHLQGLYEVIEDYYKETNYTLMRTIFPQDKVKNPLYCIACKVLIRIIKKILSHNPTRDKVQRVLTYVCNMVPRYLRNKCRNIVHRFSGKIIDFIVRRVSPSVICRLIMLCSSDVSDEEMRIMEIAWSERDMLENSAGKEGINGVNEIELQKDNVDNHFQCFLCKKLMKKLQSILSRNPTREKIKNALGKVCSIFKGKLKRSCRKLVDKYADKIITYVLRKYTPEQICGKLRLCSSNLSDEEMRIMEIIFFDDSTDETEIKDLEESENGKDNVETHFKCFLCKTIMEKVQSMLSRNPTKEMVRRALSKVCKIIPGKYNQKCHEIVNKYSGKIIDLFVKNVSPSVICSLITLCSSDVSDEEMRIMEIVWSGREEMTDLKENSIKKDNVEISFKCTICKKMMKKVLNMLDRNPTRKQIKKALGRVCCFFSGDIERKCLKLVDTYTEKIIKYVLKNYSPEQICIKLNLCSINLSDEEKRIMEIIFFDDSNDETEIKDVKESENGKDLANLTECFMCKELLNEIEGLTQNGKFKEEVKEALGEVWR